MAILNKERFGRALAMERQLAGFDSREALALAIEKATGEKYSKRQIGLIENGETSVTVDTLLALLMVLPDFAVSSLRRSVEAEHHEAFDAISQFCRD